MMKSLKPFTGFSFVSEGWMGGHGCPDDGAEWPVLVNEVDAGQIGLEPGERPWETLAHILSPFASPRGQKRQGEPPEDETHRERPTQAVPPPRSSPSGTEESWEGLP